MTEPTEVQLLVAGSGRDSRQVAELARGLGQELRALDLDRIGHPRAASPPPHAKGSAFEWAQLGITLVGSLPQMIALIQAWVRRNPGSEVSVEVDADRLVIRGGSADMQDALAREWLARRRGS